MSATVRTRYAPSPTGFQHIGGIRTALYAYVFAKKNGGQLVLRIEDTDQSRFVKGAEEYIIQSLQWLGVNCDEGVHAGGNYGPYRQSNRSDIYKKHVQLLIDNGWAYYAFDTSDDLTKAREADPNFKYGVNTRLNMQNSLSLDADTIKNKLNKGETYVIRLKVPANETVRVNDIVRGGVDFNSEEVDDKVLFKSDGLPTYHLANVVDDHLMEITHVIRGEEWLPSTPLHVLLYRAFGWEDTMPQFAHLPLLLNPDGKGKLSKRSGDKLGFPVFPLAWVHPTEDKSSNGYKEMGFLPDAFINFLAFLGWNPGTEQEIFSLSELADAFDLEQCSKSGAKFNFDKAKWYNQQYILQLSDDELLERVMPFAPEGNQLSKEKLLPLAGMLKERVTLLPDFWEQAKDILNLPESYDAKTVKKKWKGDNIDRLKSLYPLIEGIQNFESATIEAAIKGFIEENSYSFGDILMPFRVMLTGAKGGPSIFDIAAYLGKNECLNRMKIAYQNFDKMLNQ